MMDMTTLSMLGIEDVGAKLEDKCFDITLPFSRQIGDLRDKLDSSLEKCLQDLAIVLGGGKIRKRFKVSVEMPLGSNLLVSKYLVDVDGVVYWRGNIASKKTKKGLEFTVDCYVTPTFHKLVDNADLSNSLWWRSE